MMTREEIDGARLEEPLLAESSRTERGHAITVRQDAPQQASHGRLGTTWVLVMCIMLSDMFGLGTLSLPADYARLGWAPALAFTLLFAVGDVYTGVIYQRLSLAVPGAKVFDQIGYAAHGRLGQGLVFGTIYLVILGEPIMFHLTCVESLKQVFYLTDMSSFTASVIVTTLIFPLAQMHHVEDVAWVSIFGTLGMLVAMVVVVVKLLVLFTTQPDQRGTTEIIANTSIQSAFVGLMDIGFAFGGQCNWMRYLTTMQNRSHFSRAVTLTTGFMSVVYLIVAVVGYGVYGVSVDLHKPITSVLSQDLWFIVMNAGIFLHCIIAYQVNVNVLSASLLHIFLPRYDEDAASRPTPVGRVSHWLVWLVTTTAVIAMSAVVSYILPFFTIVMAIIASLGDLMSMFGLPCVFAIKLLKLPPWEKGLCWLLAAVATGLSVCGVVASVQQLVEAYIDSKS